MQSTFTLTATDFARLQKVVGRRFRRKLGFFSTLLALRVLVWLCIGVAVTTYARLLREYPEMSRPLGVVALLVAFTVLVIVAMPHLSQALIRKHMLSPRGAFLSPQTVQLTAGALIVASVTGRTELPWSGVLDRDEDDVNYYLFVDPMQAVVVPRSAVAAVVAEFEQYTSHLKNVA